MKIIEKIQPDFVPEKRRKRVAAYARVSRDTDRLLHSVSAQISYYSNLIQSNPEWEYAGVYADSGITGTRTDCRSEYLRLMQDCEKDIIDIILVKSISRFSRNTVDLLNAVRHLKELGIEVRFEKENINSLSSDGELMLSILASFAQEESRSISENVKWGIRKRFQNGTIGTANKHILGYRFDEEQQKYVIIPEEAETVRWMFQMFLDGLSYQQIADQLNNSGIRTILGNHFYEKSIKDLIYNEIYAGDLRRQKTHTPDPISKTKIKNNGELPQYYYSDCHEAIIDRETYARVQEEIKRREASFPDRLCFTGKIRCGLCGRNYSRKKNIGKGKTYFQWVCRARKEMNVTCNSATFSEQELKNISAKILDLDSFGESVFSEQISGIDVQPNGDLLYHFIGGKSKLWRNLHVTDFRHTTTITDCFEEKIFCQQCGNSYHLHKTGKYIYWSCRGKYLTHFHCKNKNYTDFQLRQISKEMMDSDEFSEDTFLQNIDHITVLENGDLLYTFKDGSEKKWQRT